MNSIEHIAANFEQVSILIADAIIARTNPVKTTCRRTRLRRPTGLAG